MGGLGGVKHRDTANKAGTLQYPRPTKCLLLVFFIPNQFCSWQIPLASTTIPRLVSCGRSLRPKNRPGWARKAREDAVNTLKNAALLVVMGGVLYFVYITLNKPQYAMNPPLKLQHESLAPPQIDIGSTSPTPQPAGHPPPLLPSMAHAPLTQPNTPVMEPTGPASSYASPAGHQVPLAPEVQLPSAPTAPPQMVAVAPEISQPAAATAAGNQGNPLRSVYGATEPTPEMVPVNPGRRSVYEATAEPTSPSVEIPPVAPEVAVATNTAATNPPANPAAAIKASHTAPLTNSLERERNLAAYTLKRDFERAEEAIQANRFREALGILTPHHSLTVLSSEDQEILYRWLDALAGKVIYSQEHHLAEAHKIQRGETLLSIGERYQVSWAVLQNVNNIRDPQVLVPGTTVKVIPGPFAADVDLSRNQLTLFVQGLYAGRFAFTLGDEPPQPGEYTVRDKSREKPYYTRDGRTIYANDGSNPYGGYWIDLGNRVCLHGSPLNANPRGANLGCVSFSPQDARDIFSILTPNSPVLIRK